MLIFGGASPRDISSYLLDTRVAGLQILSSISLNHQSTLNAISGVGFMNIMLKY